MVSLKKILDAQVYDVAVESPLQEAELLSRRLGHRVLIKREDLQPVFSFKLRGAYNKIRQLSEEERAKGIIAASAGNHAQGVALAAARLGIEAVIVMPETTPEIKVTSVRDRGARVVLWGDTFDEACARSRELQKEQGYTFIHPYDDPDVIAGQGTVALEIVRQYSAAIEAVFIPVGGGGLISGMATCLKSMRPEIKVVGVEAQDSACLSAALEAGERVKLDQVGIFADGVAVREVGALPFEIARELVDEVVTVDTDEICGAIKDLFEDTRSIAEPAGAVALAGLKKYVSSLESEKGTFVAVNSGANVNFDRLRHISERAELGEKREGLLAVTIEERPGSFRQFCEVIGKRNITEFNYRYSDPTQAEVFVGVQTVSEEQGVEHLVARLEALGYAAVDLTDDEMSKIHIRHMVGGRAPQIDDEVLFHFVFPERPGALMDFLNRVGERYNISLFHYRNHGAAYGRVLIGLQVLEEDRPGLGAFLEETGYSFREETPNPAYKLFLK